MNLENAFVYDIETFPNVFTLHAEALHSDQSSTWEISDFRDDRQALLAWFDWLHRTQTPMIGFNNINFDYPVIHHFMRSPQSTAADLYAKAMSIINSGDNRFGHLVWESDRFAPQIDLFKIHHFDNRAKSTSLKALQINMRSQTVVDMPVPVGTHLTAEQVDKLLIPYNRHDVSETKQFAHYSMKAIEFRLGLIDQFGPDVLNFNDTKIGAKLLERRLGDDVCYDRSSGRKSPRQTVRHRIALADIIFPYVQFEHPEFRRVLDYMRAQVLTPDDLTDPDAPIKTKGVFSDLTAHINGFDFHFGTGGIHGSVEAQRFVATDKWLIRDIDVTGLYPSIAIVNRLAPAHLGDAFVTEYAKLPVERAKYKKGTVENGAYKLAANGTYGNSNNKFSVFYDPQFTMTITINGQLMLCMLAEGLMQVPTSRIIQINTDGITYYIDANHEPEAAAVCERWQKLTMLQLEDANYSRMWIADVNNYVAESPNGKLKQKGRYWHPDDRNYADSVSEAGPPAWHKDLSAVIVTRAAVVAMVRGVNVETVIRAHTNPFDFMLRAKVDRQSALMLGDRQIQSTSRYYVARQGAALRKFSPPPDGKRLGDFKRRSGLTDAAYNAIAATVPDGTWDERIHTKNKSRYEDREIAFQAGWQCAECNDARSFDWNNINYNWYVQEARKLII